jgi:hypothetical protein
MGKQTHKFIILMLVRYTNKSTTTQCAENDNIIVPFKGRVSSFSIEATHPSYIVGTDSCTANFSNCPSPETGFSFTPGIFKLLDDGETVVEAVREASWWRPNGMQISVDNAPAVTDAHYISPLLLKPTSDRRLLLDSKLKQLAYTLERVARVRNIGSNSNIGIGRCPVVRL